MLVLLVHQEESNENNRNSTGEKRKMRECANYFKSRIQNF
jgi:hypothetical protein